MDSDGSKRTKLSDVPGSNFFPAWSADGTKIAFSGTVEEAGGVLNGKVFRMKAVPESTTNRPVRLTNKPGFDGNPAWSLDGVKIAFESQGGQSGNQDIWKMDARDGAHLVNITKSLVNEDDPTWQPLP